MVQFYVSSDRPAMSALGQKRTCAVKNHVSALPPKATAKADIGLVDGGRQRTGEAPNLSAVA